MDGRLRLSALLTMAWLAGGAVPVAAQAPDAPADWPCIQQYIPELARAQVWRGPDPASVAEDWASDPDVAPLVAKLASPELPLSQAREMIDAFARRLAPGERERRLLLLFRGVFEMLNGERRRAVDDALTFARQQKRLAERIREESDRLLELERQGDPAGERPALEERLRWDLRIFEERRATTAAICEQPDLIERRIFEIARHLAGYFEEGKRS